MIKLNLVTLAANAFIELNKKQETKKIYFLDLLEFNETLEEESLNNNILYECNIDVNEFMRLKYKYNTFFNFFEDYDGYVITLANGIDSSNLENYFKRAIFYNGELEYLLNNINVEEIFSKKEKRNITIRRLN